MFGAAEFACPLRPHVGERTTAPLIAPARSPPLALNRQQLAAPEWVFEAIPERPQAQRPRSAAAHPAERREVDCGSEALGVC